MTVSEQGDHHAILAILALERHELTPTTYTRSSPKLSRKS